MFCPDCGQRNPGENRFCSNCGNELPASAPAAEPQPTPPSPSTFKTHAPPPPSLPPGITLPTHRPPPPPRSSNRALMILVGLIGLYIVFKSIHPSDVLTAPTPSPSGIASSPSAVQSSGVRIVDAVACRQVDVDGKPEEAVDSFPLDATLYCSAKAYNLQMSSQLSCKCEGPGYSRSADLEPKKVGDYYFYFHFTPQKGRWEPGRYSFNVQADGITQKTVTFHVLDSVTGLTSYGKTVGVTSMVTCKDVDKDYNPIDPRDTFGVHEKCFCSVHVSSVMGKGREVVAKWYVGEQFVGDVRILTKNTNDRNMYFRYLPKGGWRSGQYYIKLYVDSQLAGTSAFTVTE